MQTENNLLLDIQHFADSDYDAESSFRYRYFLVIEQQQMISLIADEQLNRVVSVKIFSNKTVSFLEMNYDELKVFTEISDEFLPNYKSKKVIIADDASILVPDTLINSVELEAYYKINHQVKQNSQVLSNMLDFQHVVNVFNIRNEILKFVRFNMPTAEIVHQSLLFVKACFSLQKSHDENTVYLQINRGNINLLQFKNEKMNFFNNFKFDGNTDIVYFVLAVAEELGINNDLNLVIYGNIDSSDALFSLLNKYCKNINMGKRNQLFTYPNSLQNIAEHYNFTALNALLCE